MNVFSLRYALQSLSDGELFAFIGNGVRLTDVPALGEGNRESVRGRWGAEWKQLDDEASILRGH